MKGLSEIGDIKSKKVIVRAGLNVPIENGAVKNNFRLKKLLPTLKTLTDKGAKVILIGHIGRSKEETLKPVSDELSKHIKISFGESEIEKMVDGDIVMLENLRQNEGETLNDEVFSKHLSSFGEIYVNEAFSVSHRAHSSIVGLPKLLPSYAGVQLQKEIEELDKARNPVSPSIFILGGAKFETKEPLIEKFLEVYDTVFIGGALVNDFFKAKGYEVGKSRVSEKPANLDRYLDKVMIPSDVTVINNGEENTKKPEEVLPEDKIVDIGPKTLEKLKKLISEAKFILLNGPLGPYEDGFCFYTEEVVKSIKESSTHSVVGGGDTVASIAKLKIEDDISFVSTGGGAMLGYLNKGTLPGIEALK
ncbi:MAG: phosphoglycerate kinase [Candidatus Pacebacteria bacterium]|jgi:phosphoglycerate kinase|nr:phosphoglycerate kinase [bacterium]MDP6527330.1 phosphoglycerate kinase [Candidatus Paceibacterota bacterium]MDP6659392.1 phosphoglycerate kinase [Candidatus Paceibacterota bacterium]|tara:strand:- start:35565 stop:36650 length:1086 start_codon:yes stop_codon:yes gene_type:complete